MLHAPTPRVRPFRIRRSPACQLLVLPLLLVCLRLAHGLVLSSSNLETCVRDGSQASLNLTCQKMIVVTLAVGSSQVLGTDELDFSLACVGSSNGVCPCTCNYMADSSCTCRDLRVPLTLSVSKSPVWASYPMQYLQTFNFKPYEAIVRPSDDVCLADPSNLDDTCGWYYVGSYQVPDSQGFTCSCSFTEVWDTTLGIVNEQRTRANLDCDFFSDPLNILIGKPPCSAHCLMFDPLWYSGYSLGSASLQFSITVNANIPLLDPSASSSSSTNASSTPSGNSSSSAPGSASVPIIIQQETLALSPSVPIATSASQMLNVQLVGDLATYTALPVLSTQILMVPQPAGWTPDQILTTNRSDWMLLDYSMVDMTDTDCNMVGTEFSAFKWQPNACFRAPQTCLSNQLKDLQAVDVARVAAGKVPLYMVTQYLYGANSLFQSFSGGPLSFALPVTSTSTSLVVISVAADSVEFVINSSPGVINGAAVCTFADTSCGGFQAGASRGYLMVNLTNTGYINASYTMTFANCSVNIRPVEAVELGLAPGVPTLVMPPPQIYVEDNLAQADRYCWLTLYDAQDRVTDRRMVTFYTNSTVFDTKPTGGFNGTADGPGDGSSTNSTACLLVCIRFWDVACFLRSHCWGKLGRLLGVLGGSLAAVGLLMLAVKLGLLGMLLNTCLRAGCACCAGGGAGGERRREEEEERDREEIRAQETRRSRGRAAAAPRKGGDEHAADRGQRSLPRSKSAAALTVGGAGEANSSFVSSDGGGSPRAGAANNGTGGPGGGRGTAAGSWSIKATHAAAYAAPDSHSGGSSRFSSASSAAHPMRPASSRAGGYASYPSSPTAGGAAATNPFAASSPAAAASTRAPSPATAPSPAATANDRRVSSVSALPDARNPFASGVYGQQYGGQYVPLGRQYTGQQYSPPGQQSGPSRQQQYGPPRSGSVGSRAPSGAPMAHGARLPSGGAAPSAAQLWPGVGGGRAERMQGREEQGAMQGQGGEGGAAMTSNPLYWPQGGGGRT